MNKPSPTYFAKKATKVKRLWSINKNMIISASIAFVACVAIFYFYWSEKVVKIKTTTSGLKYEILQKSQDSQMPQKGDLVMVHYTGWLENKGQPGTKFDSSLDRGQPLVFKIGMGQVIKGWDEGVMAMKVGEKRRLIIPSKLAYGDRGAGNVIPPNSTLIFDVELLKVG